MLCGVEFYGVLHFLAGDGWWLERESGNSQLFRDMPPFIDVMRPQGYIGCGFPALYPELRLPGRMSDWNDDHQMIALAMRGEGCVGNLMIGEESLDRFNAGKPRSYARADYPNLAMGRLAANHALEYWSRLCKEQRLSMSFRRISTGCRDTLAQFIRERS
jgi:hypothetical protein